MPRTPTGSYQSHKWYDKCSLGLVPSHVQGFQEVFHGQEEADSQARYRTT